MMTVLAATSDETTGLEYTTALDDLWVEWRCGDLTYVDRVFLHYDDFAVAKERRSHLETLIEHILGETDAHVDTLPDDVLNAREVIADLLDI